jgi:FKBP-type peptidyl-prolyl cis-trans isomerase FkpA
MTDEQKAIYAVGLSIYKSLAQFDLSPAEVDILKRALTDAAAGKPAIELNEWGPKIEPLAKSRGARVAERTKIASKAYLDKAAAEPGVVKEPSGLIYKETKAGTGASPKSTDTVKVHYRGTLVDGKASRR